MSVTHCASLFSDWYKIPGHCQLLPCHKVNRLNHSCGGLVGGVGLSNARVPILWSGAAAESGQLLPITPPYNCQRRNPSAVFQMPSPLLSPLSLDNTLCSLGGDIHLIFGRPYKVDTLAYHPLPYLHRIASTTSMSEPSHVSSGGSQYRANTT